MVSSSWANDKAVWRLDNRQERAELDCDEPNFLEVEFNSVVVKIKIFEVADSLSGTDLFFDVLLDRGDVHEPEVIGAAE
jgi:hypothetical protein